MPAEIYTKITDAEPDVAQLGGKGASLAQLAKGDFIVPSFAILSTAFFEGETASSLPAKIQLALPDIWVALGDDKKLAVRSSATIEDGEKHSFAGQFSTLLNVDWDALPQAILEVWKSGFSYVVKSYKQAHNIQADHQMAVIVQHMVNATASGVAFSINPLTGNKNEVVINAVAGLGESLVSGQKNADSYTIAHKEIVDKKLASDKRVLSDYEVLWLASLVQDAEAYFKSPQDIEFAIEEDTFYLLQSRPITTIEKSGEQIIWDNSNIIESYPGLTLPLTFSFIQKMYEAVYRQFSLVLGVSKKTVAKNADVHANMLGLLNGRVYYNLNSWYRSLAQLPGYSINAGFMEKMMGVKEKLPIEIKGTSKSKLGSYWEVITAIIGVTKSLLNARKSKQDFITAFNHVFEPFDKKDYTNKSLKEIIHDYTAFEQLMVSRWKAPLVNDLFAMIYFGLLQKQCAKYAPDLPNIANQLIAASKDIVTTEPARLLPQLAKKMTENDALKNIFQAADVATIWQQLQEPQYDLYKAAVQQYIDVWGERSVAELKLETLTYCQQPERLIGLLKSYVENQNFSYSEGANLVKEREDAEAEMKQRLKGKWVKKRLFKHVLQQARYFVSNRENLRYYRTKGFGMVRRMMIGAGTALAKENYLQNSRDVFYLELSEIIEAAGNEALKQDLSSRVAEQKKDYQLYENMPLPERISSSGKPEKFITAALPEAIKQNAGLLQGIPCSAGVVRSKIRIVKEASELSSLNGCILATYATDPGWVVLFPSASGIITERGSLLSHAAIVSREMGIPCIVGVPGLMQQIPDGAEVLMDGSTGIVQILNTPGT